jgi:hypothetical protein
VQDILPNVVGVALLHLSRPLLNAPVGNSLYQNGVDVDVVYETLEGIAHQGRFRIKQTFVEVND